MCGLLFHVLGCSLSGLARHPLRWGRVSIVCLSLPHLFLGIVSLAWSSLLPCAWVMSLLSGPTSLVLGSCLSLLVGPPSRVLGRCLSCQAGRSTCQYSWCNCITHKIILHHRGFRSLWHSGLGTQHQWSSGRIHRCHRCGPGSIPG